MGTAGDQTTLRLLDDIGSSVHIGARCSVTAFFLILWRFLSTAHSESRLILKIWILFKTRRCAVPCKLLVLQGKMNELSIHRERFGMITIHQPKKNLTPPRQYHSGLRRDPFVAFVSQRMRIVQEGIHLPFYGFGADEGSDWLTHRSRTFTEKTGRRLKSV